MPVSSNHRFHEAKLSSLFVYYLKWALIFTHSNYPTKPMSLHIVAGIHF